MKNTLFRVDQRFVKESFDFSKAGKLLILRHNIKKTRTDITISSISIKLYRSNPLNINQNIAVLN